MNEIQSLQDQEKVLASLENIKEELMRLCKEAYPEFSGSLKGGKFGQAYWHSVPTKSKKAIVSSRMYPGRPNQKGHFPVTYIIWRPL